MGQLNVQNRTLFISDNLPILEGMNSETVHLILIDPPFNKKRQFQGIGKASKAKFNDTWTWRENVHPEWMPKMQEHNRALAEVIESAYHAHDPGMAAYIAWMSIRTLELHRILKPTGSMYLHCDPTASHYLKAMMDAIFGVGNYQNEIVWRRAYAHNDPKRFGRITDNILFYTRSSDFTWNVQHTDYSDEYINKFFRLEDERGKYQAITLTGPGVSSGDSGGRWRGYSPTDSGRTCSVPKRIVERILGPEGHLLSITERLDSLDVHGYIYWPPKGRVPRVKQYLHEMRGVPVRNLWADISYLTAHHKERTGWPTQKPLALYSRIIKSSSNEGDMVLDAFAGCATTCVAAEQLGRQWIAIDIDDEAEKVTLDRLRRETRSFSEVDGTKAGRPHPRTKGRRGCSGDDELYNLALLHRTCNAIKRNKLTLEELRNHNAMNGMLYVSKLSELVDLFEAIQFANEQIAQHAAAHGYQQFMVDYKTPRRHPHPPEEHQ